MQGLRRQYSVSQIGRTTWCGVESMSGMSGKDSPCRSRWHNEDVTGKPGIALSWAETHAEFSLLYRVHSFLGHSCSAHTWKARAGSRWLSSLGHLSEQKSDDSRGQEHSNK